MTAKATIRRFVLTGAIASITATGAWYGAGLKIQQDYKKEKEAVMTITVDDRLAQYEAMRAKLVRRKLELESKLEEVEKRIQKD